RARLSGRRETARLRAEPRPRGTARLLALALPLPRDRGHVPAERQRGRRLRHRGPPPGAAPPYRTASAWFAELTASPGVVPPAITYTLRSNATTPSPCRGVGRVGSRDHRGRGAAARARGG